MIKISQGLVERAWDNWLEFHYGIDTDATASRFMYYISGVQGYSETNVDPWDCEEDEVEVTPDEAQRVEQAVSPHWQTIFKAWYAAHPWRTLRDW